MSSAANQDTVRRIYEAYAAMDIAGIDALMVDEPVMHVPGRHPLSGVYRGKEAMWGYLAQVAAVSGGEGGFVVHAVTVDDEGHCVALLTGTIRQFVRPVIHVWSVRDGLLAEYWEANLDQQAEDDFWTHALAPESPASPRTSEPPRTGDDQARPWIS
ncbi:MAG: nuclear transport factor 2 family protein [Actinobacteria bacterium]|nr:nuclear transport factor 2 family protein [Actinomycetota bacterium]